MDSFQGMDSRAGAAVAPPKRGKLARTIAKVLNIRAAVGIAPDDAMRKRKAGDEKSSRSSSHRFDSVMGRTSAAEKMKERAAVEALMCRLFASISSIKASYAQLQLAECPYDADEIGSADQLVISELASLSELKQCYAKKQFDFSPEKAIVLAEIQEQNNALKTYKITMKKLEVHRKLKDSEIEQLRAQLEECNKQNKLMQRKLNESGHLYVLDNVHPSGLNPAHFIAVLRHTVRSIRSFVRTMVNEMDGAGWDLSSAADAITPGVVYWKENHLCFAFESFVCLEMFDGFQQCSYSLQHQSFKDAKARTRHFYEKFNELKSTSVKEYLASQPDSAFGKFCRAKYLTLIHPDLELSLCRDLTQRKLIKLGGFPETPFFSSFSEMAKRVWLLHCLALSFDPQVSIFQIRPSSRFSELYMESVAEEAFLEPEINPKAAFTVVPGFQIGKTVLQCQVYLAKQ
uniref:DUF641 domain-containing protein n=1 Tax=Kalanchoe fedtschenkoi TaxID=63787 RepID=A0A7N0TJD6_KALFE